MAFSRFQLWGMPLWGGKEETENVSSVRASNSMPDYGFGVREIDSVKFPLKGTRIASSSSSSTPRKIKKKWHSREERKIEREHDVVMVPNDGVCLSGSESDDSDWSIGWLEPHGPDFLSDDETDDSFAVLVPCYRRGPVEGPNTQFLNTIKNLTSEPFTEGKNLMDQWLSSLQNF
ncbi:uncharacterized protein LOC110682082 [Chenopodium quinoa]|uniref:uncharacterized protein LOC110682082 n=1 Tax=Chenopodium quinoa TaxID=63459 RepID=UPI000B78A1AA|nr:uncharacterized protein LOC110682082 [Chenopodium quinoa]